MNSSLHDIQSDMQRLATQQNQIQQQNLIAQQQRQIQALQQQQQYQSMQPQQQPLPQYTQQQYQQPIYQPPQPGEFLLSKKRIKSYRLLFQFMLRHYNRRLAPLTYHKLSSTSLGRRNSHSSSCTISRWRCLRLRLPPKGELGPNSLSPLPFPIPTINPS